jgi:hypothetical protein
LCGVLDQVGDLAEGGEQEQRREALSVSGGDRA